jgi:DNA-binding GntR family transcriptional regulator
MNRTTRTRAATGRDAPSQADIATSLIRESILDLSTPPGMWLDEKELLRRFRLGRTPAREALNRLAAEGLVAIQRSRGTFVPPIDVPSIRQFFDAYAASERLTGFFCRTRDPTLADDLERLQATYEATAASLRWVDTTRVNAAIHLRIADATGNRYIQDFAARLHNQARRVSFFIYRMEAERPAEREARQRHVNADHHAIVAAVRRHDNDALVDVLTRHVVLFHDRIMLALAGLQGMSAPQPIRFEETPRRKSLALRGARSGR